ncbi:MAG: 2,3-diphosphoglycerate-dependent phosphoglycerate mutase [Alphaproteobacteria bacterium]|nr:2,3-diphosphoglycerate-dependent phosphoglycerate mutase [Alphaproteobacteria bacterium]
MINNLILLRHGQSQWNLENRFTGWHDVDLTVDGEAEAKKAGSLIKNITLDRVYTSTLKRARRTALMALDEAEIKGANVNKIKNNGTWELIESDALRERDYGDLVGLNKEETAKKYGSNQVHMWRRGYEVKPPGGESLADVVKRVRPYFEKKIWPNVVSGENILVAAHGNSLRAVLVIIGEYEAEDIPNIELPTGKPLVFDVVSGVNQRKYYLE